MGAGPLRPGPDDDDRVLRGDPEKFVYLEAAVVVRVRDGPAPDREGEPGNGFARIQGDEVRPQEATMKPHPIHDVGHGRGGELFGASANIGSSQFGLGHSIPPIIIPISPASGSIRKIGLGQGGQLIKMAL